MNDYARSVTIILIILVISVILYTGYSYVSYRMTYYGIMNTRGQLEEIGKSIDKYFQNKNKYPSIITQLVPKFIKGVPRDSWNNLIYLDIGKGFLYSFGPDKRDGTVDDIFFKINTPFMLKKLQILRNISKGDNLAEGDVVRLYFTDKVCGFGNDPDNDFLFYNHNGYPVMGITCETGGMKIFSPVTFGKNANYSYVEENSDVLDIVLGVKSNIKPYNIRINLKSSTTGRRGNSILSENNLISLPAFMPLLLKF
ncbi:hypothetical protein KAJ27_12910 [bacterium]|nr:hypothetical protein [bacterium]